jgi:putative membrane protein
MTRFAFLAAFVASPALADPRDYGYMMDGSYGYGFGMMFGPVLWLIVLGLIVAGVLWLVRRFDQDANPTGKSSAASELDLRFARGEIDADEYASRKKLLNS